MNERRFRPLATFSGIRNVPFVAASHNSLYPSLTVTPGGLSIVVFRRRAFTFDEIEAVEARRFFGHMITIRPRKGWRTFTANFHGRPAAAEALRALHEAGAPLAPSALAWL